MVEEYSIDQPGLSSTKHYFAGPNSQPTTEAQFVHFFDETCFINTGPANTSTANYRSKNQPQCSPNYVILASIPSHPTARSMVQQKWNILGM